MEIGVKYATQINVSNSVIEEHAVDCRQLLQMSD